MYYRVNINGKRKFIDDRVLAEYKADGIKFEIETRNKWLAGVANEFPDDAYDGYTDGQVLDEIINLIDNGECNA